MKSKLLPQFFVLLVISFCICSCSDPKDTPLPPDVSTWESNQKLKNSLEKLPDNEKKILSNYAMRATLSGAFGGVGIKDGITIGQAIDIQKKWQEEQQQEKEKQKILARQLLTKQLDSLKRMNDALTVTLVNLRFNKSDFKLKQYSDFFSISIGFQNNSSYDIVGAKGVVILKDIFGDVIKKINLSNDNGVPTFESMTWSGTMDYNQFMDSDKKLRSTDFDKIQFEWMPDIYIFENGEKLIMPKM